MIVACNSVHRVSESSHVGPLSPLILGLQVFTGHCVRIRSHSDLVG